MRPEPKVWLKPPCTLPITAEELVAFGVPPVAIAAGEFRGATKTVGMWCLPVSYRALCMSTIWGENRTPCLSERMSETVYGMRTLTSPQQCGYELEGRVSLNGKRVRGFTSTQMFALPDGHLVNVAIIHACLDQPK